MIYLSYSFSFINFLYTCTYIFIINVFYCNHFFFRAVLETPYFTFYLNDGTPIAKLEFHAVSKNC